MVVRFGSLWMFVAIAAAFAVGMLCGLQQHNRHNTAGPATRERALSEPTEQERITSVLQLVYEDVRADLPQRTKAGSLSYLNVSKMREEERSVAAQLMCSQGLQILVVDPDDWEYLEGGGGTTPVEIAYVFRPIKWRTELAGSLTVYVWRRYSSKKDQVLSSFHEIEQRDYAFDFESPQTEDPRLVIEVTYI